MEPQTKNPSDFHLKFEGFDGPLALLWHLVQQKELDVFDFRLSKIVEMFLEEFKTLNMEASSEFIGTFSNLIYYKSQQLFPTEEKLEEESVDMDEKFDIIHQLIDYCVFKEAGKKLVFLEEEQKGFFLRGLTPQEPVKSLGIQHLTLNDLASVFSNLMETKQKNCHVLYEEEWKVSDKILFLKKLLEERGEINFPDLFPKGASKLEWIVSFLAVLELMKNGKLFVIKKLETSEIYVSNSSSIQFT